MKIKYLHFVFLFILALSACSHDMKKPMDLMIEFIRHPEKVLILDPKPEFTWIVSQESIKQSAYQIQVASSLKNIRKNDADIWNSGKIPGGGSTEIEFDGKDLMENSAYYWRVRIWDSENKASVYSSVQYFKTGSFENYITTSNSFQIALNKPVNSVKKDDYHFFDFGKAGFGKLILTIKPTQIDTLIIHLGEKLNTEHSIDKNPQGSIRYQKTQLIVNPNKTHYEILLPANKRNTASRTIKLPDSIGVVMPFRYCEIENSSITLSDDNVIQKLYSYTFDYDASYFSSSDTILNQIWDICKYSIKATSFLGIYVDGDRERIPYEGDAYINQLGHYCTDREYSMARRTNEYFISNPTWPSE